MLALYLLLMATNVQAASQEHCLADLQNVLNMRKNELSSLSESSSGAECFKHLEKAYDSVRSQPNNCESYKVPLKSAPAAIALGVLEDNFDKSLTLKPSSEGLAYEGVRATLLNTAMAMGFYKCSVIKRHER